MIANYRNFAFIAITVGLCLSSASCQTGKGATDAKVNFSPGANSKPGDIVAGMPEVPKDAQFTIACRSFTEDTHVQDSRQAQQILFDSTQMKKWYVVHSADHSTLYYGFYRTNNPHDPADADEGKRAIADQNAIRSMLDSQGNRIFSEALIVGIDAPDPQANPAWDISRTTGTWSIEIASFANHSSRKQDAVDSVRDMRAHGIEAYYYHGEVASSVCIGCWPAEAAVEVDIDKQQRDPNRPMVVTPQPLPQSFSDPLNQQGIQTIAPHVDILDPTLAAALNKFPEHSTNGETHKMIDPVTGAETIIEKPFLCRIPHKDPLDSPADALNALVSPSPVPAKPAAQQQPGTGILRSLGE